MNHILHNKLEALKELCRRYKVKSLYAFGSVNTDNYFLLHNKLTELFRRKIDLVTHRSLSNPFFIADVEQTKQLLYGA